MRIEQFVRVIDQDQDPAAVRPFAGQALRQQIAAGDYDAAAWNGLTYLFKPDAPAEIRGEFAPIQTNIPGIQIGELLPRIAARQTIGSGVSETGAAKVGSEAGRDDELRFSTDSTTYFESE